MTSFAVRGEHQLKRRWNHPVTAKSYFEDRFSHPVWEWLHKKEAQLLNKFLKEIKAQKVLALATGPARLAREVTNFHQGWAVDYSEEMLKVARRVLTERNHLWTVQKEDAFALSFTDGFFDIVFTHRFLRHFEPQDRRRLYKEIKRVLKPGGYLVFEALNKKMDPYLFRPEYTGAADKSLYDELYDPETLKQELKANGFRLVKLIPNLGHGRLYFWLTEFLGGGAESLLPRLFLWGDQLFCQGCFQWEVFAQADS